MRRSRIALISSLVISAGASQQALSDGMYVPAARPIFNWSGLYLGATAGYANGFHSSDDLAGAFLGYPGLGNDQSRGFAGGGTLGINWQEGSLVYGLETDIDWLSNKSTYVDPNGGINPYFPSETNRLNYLGTVRGRTRPRRRSHPIVCHGRPCLRRGNQYAPIQFGWPSHVQHAAF